MGSYNEQPNNEVINPKEAHDVVVIMVPFPCQSHLNQLLHLSCLISSYKIPVHYAGWATHVHQARTRFNKATSPEFSHINFHEFPTPEFSTPAPNPDSHSKFPTHLFPSFESSIHLREPMAELFKKISPTARRVVVIHDIIMCYTAQDGATFPNIELYAFNPVSAFSSYYDDPEIQSDQVPEGLPSTEGCIPQDILNFLFLQLSCLNLISGCIYNSCRKIENTYLDLVATKIPNIWAIGPINLGTISTKRNSITQHKCLDWLDKQIPNSVIYVSFGTTTSMGKDETNNLALGLESSGQKFIWVCRDADRGNIFEGNEGEEDMLPEGFEQRTKEVGMVIRDWAPQLEILEHPSTGGFMSHCGWNSCLESITMGVPIAAWPMHSDQPKNAFLVTDILKAGLTVRKWEQKDELVASSVVAKAIQTLMATKEGEEMRKKAEELGCATRQAVKEGGVSRVELGSFIAHITRDNSVITIS